jgi:DNA-binding NarL/FixJ family response regulator
MRTLVGTADEVLAKDVRAALGSRPRYCSTIEAVLFEARRWQPEAVILDVKMGGTGVRAVEYVLMLSRQAPGATVVMISDLPTPSEVREAKLLGAAAVVDRYQLHRLRVTVSVCRAAAAFAFASEPRSLRAVH